MATIANGESGASVRAKLAAKLGQALGATESMASIRTKLIAGGCATFANGDSGASIRAKINAWLEPVVVPAGNTGTVAVSEAVDFDSATNTYTFTATRSGDTSGPWNGTVTVDPSILPDRDGVIAADFGGTLPVIALAFAAGQTSKTFTVTPNSNATPE